ncbi:MAG: hypothetical protein RL220_786 [Bacteroidota bacterium]
MAYMCSALRSFIVIIALGFSLSVSGQQFPVRHLVFEGAGIRGIAYCGVVKAIEQYGLSDSLQSVAGTSAGAMTALMLSLGYTSDEMEKVISSTAFERFNDGSMGLGGGIARLTRRFGWYHSDRLDQFIASIITKKHADRDINFRQLHERGCADLYVTATSINNQKLIVFSRYTYPDMKIRDAVRISMSIPLYFEATMIDEKGNVYENIQDSLVTDIVVDGGILANFPVYIFDEAKLDSNGNKYRIPDYSVLGVRIDSDEQIELDRTGGGLAPVDVKNFPDFMEAFYLLILEQLNREILMHYDWDRTVSISSAGIGPKIRNMSPSERKLLIDSGYAYTAVRLAELGYSRGKN